MSQILRMFLTAGAGTAASMLIGLLRTKIMAFYLGPSGLGAVSMLQQFQATLMPLATLGGEVPLVQGLTSRPELERSKFLSTSAIVLLGSWLIYTFIFVVWGTAIGRFVFSNESQIEPWLVQIMVIPIILSAISAFFLAVLTSAGAVRAVQIAQVTGNLMGLVTSIPLVLNWNTDRELFLIVFLASIPIASVVLALWFLRKISDVVSVWSILKFSNFSMGSLASYLSFGSVTIITGFVTTASWLQIRREISQNLGADSLGLFSAVVSLSGIPLALLSTALMSFYLPRFSACQRENQRGLLRSVLLIVVIVSGLFFAFMELFPELIVETLFSAKFFPMIPLFKWWIAGDALRSISYVFAIPIFARKHLKFIFVSEVIFASGLLIGSRLALISSQNLVSLGYVYFATYLLYLITTWIFSRLKGYA